MLTDIPLSHPGVTVVIPTRNRSSLLSKTLRSVLQQRQVAVEVIVVDEASSDDTPMMLAALRDSRVRVIRHETPLGVSTARNHGAAEAGCEWLAFVDDDDLWAPDKLARQIEAARRTNRDWVYVGTVNISEHGRAVYGRPPLSADEVVSALPRYNAIPGGGSNVTVRRTAWLAAGPFDTRLRNTEDWEMWIRLAKHGPPACVCSPLLGYRVHGSNSSLNIAEIIRGTQLIETLHGTRADWGRLHRWLAESCLRKGHRRKAVAHFAKAAVRGQLVEVTSDVGAILRRRIVPRAQAIPQDQAEGRDSWLATAALWLQPFADPPLSLTQAAATSLEGSQ